MKKLRLLPILLIFFLLCGCLKTNILEEQSIVLALGYDAKENNNYQVTAAFIESARDNKDAYHSISVEAETSRSGRRKMNQMLTNEIATGQTRVILLNKNNFKLNMLNEIDVLTRDPFFGDMIKIAIVDGTAQDLLTYPYKNIKVNIWSLLEQNEKLSWVPSMTLHDFTFGRDKNILEQAIPILKREEEEIKLTSLALLHNNKIVGEAQPREGFFLKTLRGTDTPFIYEAIIKKEEMIASGMDHYVENVGDEVKIVIKVIKSDGKVKLTDPDLKKFDALIDIDVNIEEVSERYKFNEPGAIKALEKQLDIKLTQDLQQFLDKLREVNSDCVGFGEKYRSQVRNSKQVIEQWGDIFPNTMLTGHVKIDMIRTGIIE
ncbi:Ger(x)C family spore germination protein [Paenibacillus sp. Marseille-Q4541]|uniref:Ger(x)C family spore germination protein n=1 Tax=Paenibacillus sp. Marseille-Q4541 TaxID=2831522 RepID=UPI001BA44C14|nr:Ger(x)C family spore germination protein [Paenibacillus sp. Marseille-Q4541]